MTKIRLFAFAAFMGLGFILSGAVQPANAMNHNIGGYTHSNEKMNDTVKVYHRRWHDSGWGYGRDRGYGRPVWSGRRNCWQNRRVWNQWRHGYVWKKVNVCRRW
ncbi:MAG: hypothetical protein V4691_07640 [Pseudomonadota bacterium]